MKNQTVTSIVHHHIKENQVDNFHNWLKRIRVACDNLEGYLDSKLIDSIGDENERISVFRFDNHNNLKAWLDSSEHQVFLDELANITKHETIIESYKGLEFWFETAGPGRLKMSLITFIAILPLVFYTAPVLKLFIPISGAWMDTIATAVIVLLMTYIVMPLMMKLVSLLGLLD